MIAIARKGFNRYIPHYSTLQSQKMIVDIIDDFHSESNFKLDVINVKDRFVIQADCCGIEDLGVSLDTGNHQLVIYGTKISNDRRRYVDRIRAPDADSILFGESYIKNPYDKVKRVILNERKVGRFRRIIQLPSSDLLSSNNVHIHHNKTLGIAEIDVMKTHDDTEEEYHSDIIIEASS